MSKESADVSPRDKIAALSDAKLQALAFRAWQSAQSKNQTKRARAVRLAPLFRAELKLRKLSGIGTAH